MVGLLIIACLILLFSQEDYFLPLLKNYTISTSVFAFKLDDFTEHALSFCQVPEADKKESRCFLVLAFLKTGCREVRTGIFSQVTSNRTTGNGLN